MTSKDKPAYVLASDPTYDLATMASADPAYDLASAGPAYDLATMATEDQVLILNLTFLSL